MAGKKLPAVVFYAGVFLAAALSQPLGKGVISGTVVDGESGDAIRKAVVTLTLQGTPRRWATARTDGSGQFRFDGLPAGKYDLRATKDGEGTAIYGANKLRELGDIITLGDGEIRGSLTLRFLHSASISGHVYDSDGEPVAEVAVNLLRPGRNLGVPVLTNYLRASTDDRGEYRISNVDPGQYYLQTVPFPRGVYGPAISRQAILVDQYYGGAREFKDASPIHVSGGESLASLDFRLISEPPVEVRGQIAGVPAEPPSPETQQTGRPQTFVSNRAFIATPGGFIGEEGDAQISVTITPAEPGRRESASGTSTQGPEHRFQIGDVSAGRYRIEASYHSGNKAYGASQVFDLHPGSGEILLTLAPVVNIQGTLRVEGKAPPAEADAVRVNGIIARRAGGGFRVQLARPGSVLNNVSAEVGADGRFTLPEVTPGEWQLSLNPVPPGFLKSAKFGDKDVRFTTFEVGSSGDIPLNLVVSMNTAAVEGEVDAGSPDSKRAGILIAPVGPYHNLVRFYYGTPADNDGKFHIAGIAPGKYKIFALEKMASASFRTPEAADQLDELGEVIDVAEGSTVQVHPKLIPSDRAAQVLK